MNISNISIGTDIEEISRFETKDRVKDKNFLERIYTPAELDYCFKTQNFAQHLCARFCAKEAVTKALYSINIKDVSYNQIEITNREDGCPMASISKYPDLSIKLSMSHSKGNAVASALIICEE